MTMARTCVVFKSCSISLSNSAGELGSSVCIRTHCGCKASFLTGLTSSILSVAYAGSIGLNSAQARNTIRSFCERGDIHDFFLSNRCKKTYAIVVT